MKDFKITLPRVRMNKNESIGVICLFEKHIWTIELPWNNNLQNKSCIPFGEYEVQLKPSSTMLWNKGQDVAYKILNVPNRSDIVFMHPAYDEGDVSGCIGGGFDVNWKVGATPNSRKACAWFYSIMQEKHGLNPFTLKIVDAT
jgi:hypothetical protein